MQNIVTIKLISKYSFLYIAYSRISSTLKKKELDGDENVLVALRSDGPFIKSESDKQLLLGLDAMVDVDPVSFIGSECLVLIS